MPRSAAKKKKILFAELIITNNYILVVGRFQGQSIQETSVESWVVFQEQGEQGRSQKRKKIHRAPSSACRQQTQQVSGDRPERCTRR